MTRSQRVLIAAAVAATVAGCQTNVRTPKDTLFRLTQRNVAYRDLTLPASIDNEPLGREYGSFPAGSPPFPVEPAAGLPASPAAAAATRPNAGEGQGPRVAPGGSQRVASAVAAPVPVAGKPATAESAAAAPYKDKPTAYVPVLATAAPAKPAPASKPLANAAAPVLAPVPPPKPTSWQAPAGSTLRSVVESWTSLAGWQMRWEYSNDFNIDFVREYPGDFTAAVTNFLGAYASVEDAPHACLYPDQRPKALIRVIPSSRRCID